MSMHQVVSFSGGRTSAYLVHLMEAQRKAGVSVHFIFMDSWGLLHVVNGRVRKVHGWPKGNCCWGNPDDKPFTGNKQVECDYMLSALRRMELRGHLNEIYDGVIVNKKEGNAA